MSIVYISISHNTNQTSIWHQCRMAVAYQQNKSFESWERLKAHKHISIFYNCIIYFIYLLQIVQYG